MDQDAFQAEVRRFMKRVEPMLREYESYSQRDGRMPTPTHEAAKRHLENGNLDEAGAAVGLERAHDGKEEDSSFERRLRAFLFGAAQADAVRGRRTAADVPDTADGGEPADEFTGSKDELRAEAARRSAEGDAEKTGAKDEAASTTGTTQQTGGEQT